MITILFTGLLSVFFPPMSAFLIIRRYWSQPSFAFPAAVVLTTIFSTLLAAAFDQVLFSWFRLLLVVSLNTLICLVFFWLWRGIGTVSPGINMHRWCLVVVASGIAILDVFYIYWVNGLPLTGAGDALPYLSSRSLGIDVERTIILVGEVIRGSLDGFLYNTIWHHWAAMIITPWVKGGVVDWAPVAGAIVATAAVFFFLLFWGIAQFLCVSLSLMLGIFIIAAVHVDFVYGALSWLLDERWGMSQGGRLGGGAAQLYMFRHFSPKFAALLSPQHTLFLLSLAAFIPIHRQMIRERIKHQAFTLMPLLFVMAVASPILTAISLLPYAIACVFIVPGFIRQTLPLLSLSIPVFGLALIAYSSATGISVMDIYFSNKEGPSLVFFPEALWQDWRRVVLLPFTYSFGAVALFCLLVICLLRRHGLDPFSLALTVATLLATGIWGPVISDNLLEINRHFAISYCLIVLYASVGILSSFGVSCGRMPQVVVFVLALFGVVLHIFFFGAYALNRSVIDRSVNYDDYDCINKSIYRNGMQGVFGAAYAGGQIYPIQFRATRSFVNAPHQAAYQASAENQMSHDVLDRLGASTADFHLDTLLLNGDFLNFSGFVWGPIEERRLGSEIRRNLLKQGQLIKTCGVVGLFRFKTTNNTAQKSELDKKNNQFLNRLNQHMETVEYLEGKNISVVVGNGKYYASPFGNGEIVPPKNGEVGLSASTVKELADLVEHSEDTGLVIQSLNHGGGFASFIRKFAFIDRQLSLEARILGSVFRFSRDGYDVFETAHQYYYAIRKEASVPENLGVDPIFDGYMVMPFIIHAHGAKDIAELISNAAPVRTTSFYGFQVQDTGEGHVAAATWSPLSEFFVRDEESRIIGFRGFSGLSKRAVETQVEEQPGLPSFGKGSYKNYNIALIGQIYWAFRQDLGPISIRDAELSNGANGGVLTDWDISSLHLRIDKLLDK